MSIDKFDYEEPRCILDRSMYTSEPVAEPIPVMRVLKKLDEFFEKNDLAGAEKLMDYWIAEAKALGDVRGEFTIKNELLGIYRKEGKMEKALSLAEEVLGLCEKLGNTESPDGATAFINVGTVYKAFGKTKEALPIFNKAKELYEKYLDRNDERLAGLYNNMALVKTDLEEYRDAEMLFLKALDVLSGVPGSEPEQAVTYLNIASLEEAAKGTEGARDTIEKCVDRAWKLLDQPGIAKDGNYAFVCDKCAPGFEHFGYSFYAGTLKMRAEEIYSGAER